MNHILRTTLIFAFFAGFSSICVSKAIFASGGSCGKNCEHMTTTKTVAEAGEQEAAKDPVCGMKISNVEKAPSEEFKGRTYYFCSEYCKKSFKKDPQSYAKEEHGHGEDKGHVH